MALIAEIGHDGKYCDKCKTHLAMKVLKSPAAGYYLGTACLCGPFSRESVYFASKGEAEDALDAYYNGRVGAFLRTGTD